MKHVLRFAAAVTVPAALSLAGLANADPMAAARPMSASPMAASPMAASPMATSPMAADAMSSDAKSKPKMKHHGKKPTPATGAMSTAPTSTGAMGH